MGILDDLTGKDTKKKGNALGFFSFLEDLDEKDKQNKRYKELEELGLEDWEIKKVLEGEFEPQDFEEEDLEDDSYYEEEDI